VSYNIAGFPSKMQRKPSVGSFSDLVKSFDYAPTGQITTTVFGNKATTTRTYDSNAIYRLSQLQTWAAGNSLIQNFAYTYDPAGNLTQITDYATASSSAVTIFTYDALNRLLSASTTAATSTPYDEQYSYDSLGNILTKGQGSGGGSSNQVPTIMDTLDISRHSIAGTS